MYNPLDDTGEAINCAIDAYKIAANYINSRKKSERQIAKLALARGLHFIVDALTPAHHYGHPIPEEKEGIDWHDPHWQRNRSVAFNTLFRAHAGFEFKCAKITFFKTKKIRHAYKKLKKSRPTTELPHPEDLRHFLKQKARNICSTRLYERFLEGEKVDQEILKELIPEIIHTVEIYIRSLYACARLKKSRNGRLKIPRIRLPRTPSAHRVKSAVLQSMVSAKSRVSSAGRKIRDKSRARKSDKNLQSHQKSN